MKVKKNQMQLLVAVSMTLFSAFIIACSSGATKSDTSGGQRVQWTQTGIGGGGAQFGPAVSPHDEKLAFVSCDMGGSFVTHDGGESWRMFSIGGQSRFFLFDPVDPNVVYAQSGVVYKSVNKGLTWSVFYPKASNIAAKVSKGDHAGVSWVTKDSTRNSLLTLSIDPIQSKNLYAAIRDDRGVSLQTSTDGGETWKKEKEFDHDIKSILIDPTSPADQRTLYIGWSDGVEQRVNGKWQTFGTPGNNIKFNLFSAGFDEAKKKYIIYTFSGKGYFNSTSTDNAIYISEDGGKSWKSCHEGLLKYCVADKERVEFRSLTTCAFDPSTIYVSYNNFKIHPDTTCIGVAISTDYGKTWNFDWQDKMFRGSHLTSPNFTGDWMDIWSGPGWGENPFHLAVAPRNSKICYGADFGRTLRTNNGGKTWDAVYTKKLPDGSWTSRGIHVTTGYDIAFDPFDERHIFVSLTDIGLQESWNGGEGWHAATPLNGGIPRHWRNTTYWVTFDPEVQGRVWAVMSSNHDLPRPKMFRRGGVERYTGGIVRTDNGGGQWDVVSASIGEAAMTHILLDPKSSKDSRTLYACAFGKGVYKSTDGGLNWVQKNNGIEGVEPFAFSIERRESDGTLFLIVSRRSEDGGIGNDQDGALYKSTDGAESWTKMTLPVDCNGPTDIVTSKKYPKRLVLSAWGRSLTRDWASSDIGGGIFISDDEGKTWTQVMDKDQHIYAVSFDPRNGRYYACGFNASAYYSEDGAKTWTRIRGYNFKWGHRVTPDPRDPNMIFVLTFGGGVWHGPATGDPEATEDVLDIFETR